ncbi:putative glutamine-serine-proline rich [Diaporthe ampelina]|uniref:Putative glutamine-serine-proline rich n=1 Tax=Diaporthe ampelina TaxID=1214573 RepID=A0A0G2FEC2_9PEZI|nr:putative glutamine-serine-proline rich [Diaporthe ampelina]
MGSRATRQVLIRHNRATLDTNHPLTNPGSLLRDMGTAHPPSNNQPGNGPEGEDRGVMGALAGGAAGAWAGHRVNHGLLGALGGAFAGHKLQDAFHDHTKHKNDEHKQSHSPQPPQYAQQSPLPPPEQHFVGNFSASSTQMNMDGDYDLIASCRRRDGSQRLTSISLNNCLTNDDGHFRWAKGGNFGASARNVRLIDGGRTLEAELRNCGGSWVWDRIALDERIGNSNGDLVMA